MARWTEGAAWDLAVVARDGDAKDQRDPERRAQRLAEREANLLPAIRPLSCCSYTTG